MYEKATVSINQKLLAVNFLTTQSEILSTVPKCLSDLCHTE